MDKYQNKTTGSTLSSAHKNEYETLSQFSGDAALLPNEELKE